MQLTKLEVAERQLRQAIRLFFSNGDEVAIHRLTCAVRGVLCPLAKAKGTFSLLEDNLAAFIRLEKLDEVQRLARAPQNCFKHAKTDPADTLDFSSDVTPLLLFDACVTHFHLAGYHLVEGFVFLVWTYLRNVNFLLDGPAQDFFGSSYPRAFLARGLDHTRRDVFLALIEELSKDASRISAAGAPLTP